MAHAIELGAPLGHIGLVLARRATDRDHDGASYLFGGGDCDDSDPSRSPNAIDIPGNGIDEDCSGSDLPLPHRPPPPPPTARAAVPHDLNLVLITVDTLRIDLGFMGYPRPVSPNLDALAARSTVFDRAYSLASYTGKSLGPTLIGKYPSETFRDGSHFDTYAPDNVFLAERLRNVGFHTMGLASHWYFKPKYGLTQGMDTWDLSALPPESAGDIDGAVTSEALSDAAIRLLSDPVNGSRRFFMWAHYFDPHANYIVHPEAPDFRPGQKMWAKPLYDGEVWFTDHHIGRLLDFIASQPWGKQTAIIVTSDHGEAFEEHGMSYHGVDLWEQLVRVPLVVYVPGVKPHRVKQKRSNIDLVPTVLDLLGVTQPPDGELSGESNAGAIVSPDEVAIDERDVLMDMPWGPQVAQHRALIHGPTPGLKLMAPGGPVYQLYDLSKDEAELNDVSRAATAPCSRAWWRPTTRSWGRCTRSTWTPCRRAPDAPFLTPQGPLCVWATSGVGAPAYGFSSISPLRLLARRGHLGRVVARGIERPGGVESPDALLPVPGAALGERRVAQSFASRSVWAATSGASVDAVAEGSGSVAGSGVTSCFTGGRRSRR